MSFLEVFATAQAEELQQRLIGAEVVIVNKVRLDGETLRAASTLRLIAVVATGTDIIDLAAAAAQRIAACNCQAYGTDSVSQNVFVAISTDPLTDSGENIAAFKTGRPLRMVSEFS